jgi:hypothetical protein
MSRHLRTVTAICSLLAVGLCFSAISARAADVFYYFVSGVADDGGGNNVGMATSFPCTNLDRATQTISFVVHASDGAVVGRGSAAVAPKQTITASTHRTLLFVDDVILATGGVLQGYATISATSPNLVCSAMIFDASLTVPNGIALHLQRRAPLAKTQE